MFCFVFYEGLYCSVAMDCVRRSITSDFSHFSIASYCSRCCVNSTSINSAYPASRDASHICCRGYSHVKPRLYSDRRRFRRSARSTKRRSACQSRLFLQQPQATSLPVPFPTPRRESTHTGTIYSKRYNRSRQTLAPNATAILSAPRSAPPPVRRKWRPRIAARTRDTCGAAAAAGRGGAARETRARTLLGPAAAGRDLSSKGVL